MPTMLYYVCDRCGNEWRAYHLPDDGAGCPACACPAVWEFYRPAPAREHAAHIRRIAGSGLFRHA